MASTEEWVQIPVSGWNELMRERKELQARVKELEGIVSGKTMYDAAAVAEQRGAERVFAALSVHFAGHPDFDRALADFDQKGLTKEGAADSRSLLDSGEEQECPDCGSEDRTWFTPCRNNFHDKSFEESINSAGSRASTPSPAIEGRAGGVGIADMEAMMIRQQAFRDHQYEEARKKLSGDTDKVEVNREDLEYIVSWIEGQGLDYGCEPDIKTASLRAALAAFRATEEGK